MAEYFYRCRYCNRVFVSASGHDADIAANIAGALIGHGQINLHTCHGCDDDTLAIADLIYARKGASSDDEAGS